MIPPREYVFIVDVSGSMHGFPLDTTKALMRTCSAGCARPTASTSCCSRVARACSREKSRRRRRPTRSRRRSRSSIARTAAAAPSCCRRSQRAMKLPRAAKDMSRSFVVVTDGYIAEEPAMFEQHPRPPRRRERVLVRHRQLGQPPPHRRRREGRPGRAVRHPRPGAGRGRRGEVPRLHRVAGAHARRREVRRLRRVPFVESVNSPAPAADAKPVAAEATASSSAPATEPAPGAPAAEEDNKKKFTKKY